MDASQLHAFNVYDAEQKNDIDNYTMVDVLHSDEYFTNFVAIITIIAGNESFINDMGIDYHIRKRGKPIYDGITFIGSDPKKGHSSGHFHWKKNTVNSDSYTEKWQSQSSNGFCQTYALMGYLNQTKGLKKGNYLDNAVNALRFLQTYSTLIASYWIDVCEVAPFYFAYCYLTADEIEEDIEILLQDERLLNHIIVDEIVYAPYSS